MSIQNGTTLTKEGLEYLCGLIRDINGLDTNLIDDINIKSNGTFSSPIKRPKYSSTATLPPNFFINPTINCEIPVTPPDTNPPSCKSHTTPKA